MRDSVLDICGKLSERSERSERSASERSEASPGESKRQRYGARQSEADIHKGGDRAQVD